MAGWSPEGFVAKTKEEILASLQTRQASLVDPSLNQSAAGVSANLNATFAEELAECWEAAQEVWDAHDPNSAEGIAADHIGALSGLIRENKKKATVTLELTMAANTTVVAGSVASIPGNPSARFVTLQDAITLGSPDTISAPAEAETAGPLSAGPGQITKIESPTSGWTAVTNPAAATQGSDVETDEKYRAHRVEVIASQGGSTVDGVLADVRKLDTVSAAEKIENYSDAVVDGLPP